MRIDWHEEAQEEYGDSAAYYELQAEDLGERFVIRMESAVARIFAAPLMPRCFEGECRKVRVEKFPYSIIYRVKGDELQILAVMHAKRAPGYWKSRMKD